MAAPQTFRVYSRTVRADEIPTLTVAALVGNATGASGAGVLAKILNVAIEVVSEVGWFVSAGTFRLYSDVPGGEKVGRASFCEAIGSIFGKPGAAGALAADAGAPAEKGSPVPTDPAGDPRRQDMAPWALFVRLPGNQADGNGVTWDSWHPVADSSFSRGKRKVSVRFSDGAPKVTFGALERVEVATVQSR